MMSANAMKLMLPLLLCLGVCAIDALGQTASVPSAQVARVVASVKETNADDAALTNALGLGEQLISEGRFGEAADVFGAVLEKSPRNGVALYGAALAAFNLGKKVDAESYARSAVEVNVPNSSSSIEGRNRAADSLVLLAVVVAVKGDDTQSLKFAEQAAQIAPKHFDAQFTLGRALYGAGDNAKAVEAFRAAIALKPKDARTLFFLGTTLERAGDIDGAIAAYRQLIANNPNAAEGHLGVGVLLARRSGEQKDEGIRELQRATEINPNMYEARVGLGRALIARGRPQQAVDHLIRASELAPGNPEPHYQLSLAYRRLGLKEKAAQEEAAVKRIHENRRGGIKTANSPE